MGYEKIGGPRAGKREDLEKIIEKTKNWPLKIETKFRSLSLALSKKETELCFFFS